MERHLASIQKVAEIKPIEKADAIEAVRINGWWVVAKKGEFAVNDFCIFFEVDSVLPVCEEFNFLRKGCYQKRDWLPNGEGFRLKTVRLRGQLSQGLVVPIPTMYGKLSPLNIYEGRDVTELLGVVKWDPPVPTNLSGIARGNFPSFIPKTDQERAQNLGREIFSEPNDSASWEVTVKLDGSSCTIYMKDGVKGVCSRNLELDMSQVGNSFVDMAMKLDLPVDKNYAYQGELVGPGIQGNRENLANHEFYVFDIWDIDNQCYITPSICAPLCKLYGLNHVPVLHGDATLANLHINDMQDLIEFADGWSMKNPVREGVVFKRDDGEFSFKVISNEFLEEEE